MANTELMQGIAGLLAKPGLMPEARALIEMSLEAQRQGRLPSVGELRERLAGKGTMRQSDGETGRQSDHETMRQSDNETVSD